MPFKSEKQRRWMHANDPEMAKKWEKKEKKMKREQRVRELIKKMVREIMKEDFAGAHPAHKRKKFDKMRQKQSEVLGYKLMGTPDVRTEIDDATVKENVEEAYKLVSELAVRNKFKVKEGGPGSGPSGNGDDEDNPFDREPSDDELADIEKQFEG